MENHTQQFNFMLSQILLEIKVFPILRIYIVETRMLRHPIFRERNYTVKKDDRFNLFFEVLIKRIEMGMTTLFIAL